MVIIYSLQSTGVEVRWSGGTAILAFAHEGTTAILMTVQGHQGKFKNSKGASQPTMNLLSFDKLYLSEFKDEREGAGLVCPLLCVNYIELFSLFLKRKIRKGGRKINRQDFCLLILS